MMSGKNNLSDIFSTVFFIFLRDTYSKPQNTFHKRRKENPINFCDILSLLLLSALLLGLSLSFYL